jgi:hypothetical protein
MTGTEAASSARTFPLPDQTILVWERFRGHPWFDATVEFCERYDENCFDPAYEWLPLEHFAPAVEEVFSREPSFR